MLLVLWVLIQLLLYLHFGLRQAFDTTMYVEDAHTILSGATPESRSVWYISYSSFLALVFLLGGTLFHVALLQILISGLAAIYLYKLLDKIGGSSTALIGTLMFLLWVKIHEWNAFIYTESLFTSFCIISFYALSVSKKAGHWALTGVLLLFTFFIRPTGFGLIVGYMAFGLFQFSAHYKVKKWQWGMLIALAFLMGAALLNKMMHHYPLLDSYAMAETIYPKITLGIAPPADMHLPEEGLPPLYRLLLFIYHNPLYFLKLATVKFLLFFGNVKPYFSTLHNVVIIAMLYPIYGFAVTGARHFPKKFRAELAFILAFILTQGATVTLSSENWDGRFLLPVLPFVFVLAAVGIRHYYLKRIGARQTDKSVTAQEKAELKV